MTGTTGTLNVVARKTGKGQSGKYRQDRQVPAVVYGPKMENQNCLIDEIFVLKHSGSKHESSIFQTKSDDGKLNSLKVMLKNIDTHPGSGRPIHVDLYALDMTAKIKVNVPLELVGTPAGVKEGGGVLQTTLRDVEIEVDPTSIPETIQVDISGLELNGSIHISDVTFPAGSVPMTPPERTICTVSVPKEEPAEPVAEVAAEGAEGADAAAAAPAAEGDKKD